MIVNLIYDLSQYRLCLDPIRDELITRGHKVIYSKNKPAGGADCSVAIQAPGPVVGAKHPIFFIQHGLSCTKAWGNNQPINHYLSPAVYWSQTLYERMKTDPEQRSFALVDVGWPRMDCWHRLLQNREYLRDEIKRKHQLDGRPIVCYWPTYKGGGHAERPVAVHKVYEILRSEFNCFVGPHQMEGKAKDEYMKGLSREVREEGPNQRLILYEEFPDWSERTGFLSHVPEDAEIEKWEKSVWSRLAYLVAADAMVSDNSGTAYEYLATDRPLIFLDKPSDPHYFKVCHHPAGKEIDMGAKASINSLVKTVYRELVNPDRLAVRRRWWRNFVVGPVDGGVASRTVDYMEKAVSGQIEEVQE